MKAKILIISLVLAIGMCQWSVAMARDAGVDISFPSIVGSLQQPGLNDISLSDDLGLLRKKPEMEAHASWVNVDYSVRAFHSFLLPLTGVGIIYPGQFLVSKDKKEEFKAVESSMSFGSGRLELGLRYHYNKTVSDMNNILNWSHDKFGVPDRYLFPGWRIVIEPQIVIAWTRGSLNIGGENFEREVSLNSLGCGAGVHFEALFNPGYAVLGKINATSTVKNFEVGFKKYTRNNAFSVGYRHQHVKTGDVSLTTNSPYFEVGFKF